MQRSLRAALVFGSIVVSLASNWWFGSRIGPVSRLNELAFTPRDGAFSIWGVIYPLLCAHAAAALWRPVSASDATLDLSALALSASLSAAALWVPLFAQNSAWASALASVTLQLGFGCSYVACIVMPRPSTLVDWATTNLALGLFAGWMLVAAFLTSSIALKLRGCTIPEWLPLLAASGGAVSAIVARSPEFAAAQIWAFAWSQGEWTGASRALAGLAFAVSLARLVVEAPERPSS